MSSSWEKSFLSYKCVLLIYIWNKGKIRGSCMSLGRNATIPCTFMYQENRSQVAGTALAWRLETPVFRKGWIWKGIGLHVLKLPSTVRDFPCLSGVRRWVLESWPLFLLPGTHEINDDFAEQRQKGRSLNKFGGAFTLACIFLDLFRTGVDNLRLQVKWDMIRYSSLISQLTASERRE